MNPVRHHRLRLVLASTALGLMLSFGALAEDAAPLARANAYLAKGDYRAAEVELKALLQKDPGLVDARLLLGRTYLGLGDGAAAAKELQRAAELGADASKLRFDLAEAKLQQGLFKEVLQDLDLAGIDPSQHAMALAMRGRALIGLEEIDQARAAFAEAAKLDPNDRVAGLGLAQLALMDNDTAGAAATVDRLLATSQIGRAHV